MRRETKQVKNQERIEKFLADHRVGYLGLFDEEGTYVVPLNYTWLDGKIYFHGSREGRKYDALRRELTVCFTVSEEYGTIAQPVPGNTGTAYFSVMIFGKAREVKEMEEATAALQSMLDKYVPGYFPQRLSQAHVERYRSSLGSSTIVYRIDPERITAKEDNVFVDQLFFPGRKQIDDLRRRK